MKFRRTSSLFASAVVAAGVAIPAPASAAVPPRQGAYNKVVLADNPIAYFSLNGKSRVDLTGNRHRLSYHGGPRTTSLPNRARATVFDGRNDYVQIADRSDLSVGNRVLSIEAWVRVDDLNNEDVDNGQYVHWLGKGDNENHEYALRLYNDDTDRSSRMSGYVFNPEGGTGEGSYFQDNLRARQWIHVGVVFDGRNGRVTLYRDGRERDSDSFDGVEPTNEDAPLRIGSRDLNSFLQGAVARLAVYNYDASSTFDDHVRTMRRLSR